MKIHTGMSLRVFEGNPTLLSVHYRNSNEETCLHPFYHGVVFCMTLADFGGHREAGALQGKNAQSL